MSQLVEISRRLSNSVARMKFADPVAYVYNPLSYAWAPHERYLSKFGTGPKKALMLGMNPGPFGMAQTGVPFGEISAVRDWMGIEEEVKRPRKLHPKRPIDGFACTRSEVSGRRLWGWAQERFGRAENFFGDYFVYNYCPLVFMEESARNLTPDKLPAQERKRLFDRCDSALREVVETLGVSTVIGVGAFAEKRAQAVVGDLDLEIFRVPHPSPASPAANRGWSALMDKAMRANGIEL